MRRATDAFRSGTWPRDNAAGQVTLDFDARHRRRIRLDCEGHGPILLDLPHARALRDGDGLKLDDNSWIEVRAAPEALLEISAGTAMPLNRIAWHLGNRHCPAEILPDRIFIRADHVLEEMLTGLGATVSGVDRPFDPEPGAYAKDHDHG